MLTRHCDAPDCDTWGNSPDWLDVYDGDGELVATLCCRWCLAKWGAVASPTEVVG